MEVAILGGGCFWCLEAVFEQLRGVVRVTSGYCGGTLQHPTYEAVCSGATGHAEVDESGLLASEKIGKEVWFWFKRDALDATLGNVLDYLKENT